MISKLFNFRKFSSPILNSLKETFKGLKETNTIVEFDTNLSAADKANKKRFLIYRYDPSNPEDVPKYISYYVDLKSINPMYLDALIKIKDDMDPTLSFRRSCREGICGSCSMNVDGIHSLACIRFIDTDLNKPAIISPLGHMFVLKDLVVDMTNFYSQYKEIQPYLQRKNPKEDESKEYYQSEEDREKLDGLYECVLCASCSTSCPSYWWHPEEYLGPAVLMQAYRWVVDSRDEFESERLEYLSKGMKLNSCENIGMCTVTCPKNLDPQKTLQDLMERVKAHKLKKSSDYLL